jgi:hypothetical protein
MGGIDLACEAHRPGVRWKVFNLFLPAIADLLIPDNDNTRAYKERQRDMLKLSKKFLQRKTHIEEFGICKDLKNRNIINQAAASLIKIEQNT